MSDPQYKTFPYRFQNGGLVARDIYDKMRPGSYRNLQNLESRAEQSLSTRYGLKALTTDGTTNLPLGAPAQSLSRMQGLGSSFNYAAASNGNLYRKGSDGLGAYSLISSGLSGGRASMFPYRPNANANPYEFIADDLVLLKDNGSGTAQNWGITAPQRPTLIAPAISGIVNIDLFDEADTTSFTLTNVTSPAIVGRVSGAIGAPLATGINLIEFEFGTGATASRTGNVTTVSTGTHFMVTGMRIGITAASDASFLVSSVVVTVIDGTHFSYPNQGPNASATGVAWTPLPSMQPGMSVTIHDGASTETIYVTEVTSAGFIANCQFTHATSTTLSSTYLAGSVAANTTASITKTGKFNLTFPNAQEDPENNLVQVYLLLSNPLAVREIKIMLDVGDGTFTQDYYYKSVSMHPAQAGASNTITGQQITSGAVSQRAIGSLDVRSLGTGDGSILPGDLPLLQRLQPKNLNPGLNPWTLVSARIGEFQTVGAAGTPTNGPDKVIAWRIQIITNPNSTVSFGIDDLAFVGGSDLDSFAGQPYDYRMTYYNINTGCESSPSQPMVATTPVSNLYVGAYLPVPLSVQRQAISVSLWQSTDSQVTHIRIYRRGGTLTNGWFFVAQVPAGTATYIDTLADSVIEINDLLNVDADAPVTTTLQSPLNTTISALSAGFPWEASFTYSYQQHIIDTNGNAQLVAFTLFRSITQVAVDGANHLTLTVSIPISFADRLAIIGQQIYMSSLVSATFLNGRIVTITGATSNTIAATFTHAAYGPTADTGVIGISMGTGVSGSTLPSWAPSWGLYTADFGIVWLEIGIANVFAGQDWAVLTLPTVNNIFVNQILTIGTGQTQEQVYVQAVNPLTSTVTVYLQFNHAVGETISATTRPTTPMNLMAIAFDKAWLAGDPNNPHVLYYSTTFEPETFPVQNSLEVGTPDAPITALIEMNGLLYVFTTKRVYQVLGAGSAVPTVIPTGCKHGLVAPFAWTVAENAIYYLSYDGIYVFSGGSSGYISEPVEWIWLGKNLGPVPALGSGQATNVFMSYCNHEVFVNYTDGNGNQHRLIYHDVYRRWRFDDTLTAVGPGISAQYFAEDIGMSFVAKNDGMVYQDRVNDYDSGGFSAGVEIQNAIAFAVQTAQMDQSEADPGNAKKYKVYNELTIDADLNSQSVNVSLLFDNGNTVEPMGVITGSGNGREQFQLNVNNGDGQESLNVGLLITGSTTKVITLSEVHIRAAVQAESRRSWDTWWIEYGVDEWHIYKQFFPLYKAPDPAGISVLVFTDGNMDTPVYSFVIPSTGTAHRMSNKLRLPAIKCRQLRMIGTSPSDFHLYDDSQLEHKKLGAGKGYERGKISP